MKRILTAILCACICAMSLAQNATILSAARSELSKRGLTEAEVRERLLENGIDVDTIQPSEYAAYQDRVTAILDQMQAEKDGKAGKGESGTARQAGTQTGTQAGTQAGPQTGGSQTWKLLNAGTSGIPVTTDEEALAEQALADATAATDTMSVEVKPADGSDIYGHALSQVRRLMSSAPRTAPRPLTLTSLARATRSISPFSARPRPTSASASTRTARYTPRAPARFS